jgi:hypothetical protein
MSLTDALLLEPYRDPREVWIALRTDGQRGSGTMADPYDGSRRDHPAFSITSLTKGGPGNRIATAVTTSNHPFLPGDMVTIVGVATGLPGDRCYTGTFPVLSVDTNSFTYQMLWEPTSTSAPGTSISCFREREQFDAVLRALPANSVIHVGPGVFESKGTASGIQSWAPKSGQRILGSGRGVTILKLVNASWPELHYVLIGDVDYASFIEDFELSDLTFDCNIAGQPEHLVSCAAISVVGRHLRLHRLHAINFSSQTTDYIENFVFAVAAPHPDAGAGKEGVNNVIEDCIAEQPGLNRANNSSAFILATGENPTNGIMVWHRACAIRQCWYDGRYADRPVSIASIAIAAGVATVTTRAPHNRSNGEWVVIAGAVENGSEKSAYNGSYPISNVSTCQFSYSPVAYDGLSIPTSAPTGDMWVDRFSSHRVSVKQIEKDPGDPDGKTAILTCHGPHYRKPGQWVRVVTASYPPKEGTAVYFGCFAIMAGSITAPNVLKYRMASAPGVALVLCLSLTPDNPPAYVYDTVFVGVGDIGFSTDGGSEAVAEGNCVFGIGAGGSYHDTWGTKDQTDRDNYYSDVLSGPYQNMGGWSPPKLGSLSVIGTTATFTTTQPHGLVVGQAVRIASNIPPPPEQSDFYQVATVPSLTSFTFDTGGTTPPGNYFGALWQVGLAIRDSNVIELGQAYHLGTYYGYSSGLPFLSGAHGTQYVFRRVIARDNVIRLIPSQSPLACAIELGNVENAVIEHNVIDLPGTALVVAQHSRQLQFFNNVDPSGALVPPVALFPTDPIADDLRVHIEDALILAL